MVQMYYRECIKATAHELMPLYVAFFNLSFDSGVLLDSRLEGVTPPLYIHNGDSKSLLPNLTLVLMALLMLTLSFRNTRLLSTRLFNDGSYFCIACTINKNCKTTQKRNCSVRLLILIIFKLLVGLEETISENLFILFLIFSRE